MGRSATRGLRPDRSTGRLARAMFLAKLGREGPGSWWGGWCRGSAIGGLDDMMARVSGEAAGAVLGGGGWGDDEAARVSASGAG